MPPIHMRPIGIASAVCWPQQADVRVEKSARRVLTVEKTVIRFRPNTGGNHNE
ncbi:hypothetical protein BH23PSE2_BH23PSE2_00930 [soil metagenome]